MKYKIFLGKGQRPLATPARGPVQPCGPRDHLSVCFLRSQIAPTPPIYKWIDGPDWNPRLSCVPYCNVLRITAMNIFTL